MSHKENQPSEAFTALLGDLGTLNKSMDEQAAADAAAAQDGEGAAAEGEAGDNQGAAEGENGKTMTKSIKAIVDGVEVEAEDGTALVKALQEQVSGLEGVMAKALGAAVELIKKQGEALTSTNALVKSLQTKVETLSNAPAGRKTVLTVHEKTPGATMAKSQPEGDSPEEFMAKCLDAQKAGRITGLDVSVVEAALNRSAEVPSSIINAVYRKS